MKKLLMIGSILILGMTAFAGVESDLIEDNGSYKGEARLTVGSIGRATDGTTSGMLIVTPTLNGSTDGTGLEFNFGDLYRGTSQKTLARFKAEVVNENGELATLADDNVEVKLQTVAINNQGGVTITDKQKKIENIQLKNSNSENLGILSYEISSEKINNSGKTFEAEIVSTVTIDKTIDKTGTFDDNSARVSIAVTGLNKLEWN